LFFKKEIGKGWGYRFEVSSSGMVVAIVSTATVIIVVAVVFEHVFTMPGKGCNVIATKKSIGHVHTILQ